MRINLWICWSFRVSAMIFGSSWPERFVFYVRACFFIFLLLSKQRWVFLQPLEAWTKCLWPSLSVSYKQLFSHGTLWLNWICDKLPVLVFWFLPCFFSWMWFSHQWVSNERLPLTFGSLNPHWIYLPGASGCLYSTSLVTFSFVCNSNLECLSFHLTVL